MSSEKLKREDNTNEWTQTREEMSVINVYFIIVGNKRYSNQERSTRQ